jgi:hypothetical protein
MKRSELEVGQLVMVERGHRGGPAVVVDTEPWHNSGGWRSEPRKGTDYTGARQGVAVAQLGSWGTAPYQYKRVLENLEEGTPFEWTPTIVQLRQLSPIENDGDVADWMAAEVEEQERRTKRRAQVEREQALKQKQDGLMRTAKLATWQQCLQEHGIEVDLEMTVQYGKDQVRLSADDFTKLVAALG